MSGRLVVCPTPIGNLEDVTLRVLAALREADIVACEDTRRTRVLLDRYGVRAHLVSYHEHNEAERTAELVQPAAPLTIDSALREMCFGTWEGHTIAELRVFAPAEGQ